MTFAKNLLTKIPGWNKLPEAVQSAIVALAVAVIGWIGHKFLGDPKTVEVTKTVEVEKRVNVVEQVPFEVSFGWVEDKEAVAKISQGLAFKVFSDTPAGQADEPLPKAVYLWHAYKQLTGRNPPEKNQNPVGSCVSFGTNNAIERTMAVQIAMKKLHEEFKFICEEVTYAGSRVEVGGGRIGGDGSVGAWAAKFVKDWGVVAREKVLNGKYDLSKYDPTRCRDWGKRGVPDDLEPLAREHSVHEITQVKSWEEAKRALANGYGIAICSNQGFTMQRDARGIARASGSWAHCMCLDGYHVDSDGKEYGHIENSWGATAHTGPVGWGDPSPAGFWADSATIDRMVKYDDSWAFSAVKGFPKQRIDWSVQAPMPERKRANFLASRKWLGEPQFTLAP